MSKKRKKKVSNFPRKRKKINADEDEAEEWFPSDVSEEEEFQPPRKKKNGKLHITYFHLNH